jgi:hypothetical protein
MGRFAALIGALRLFPVGANIWPIRQQIQPNLATAVERLMTWPQRIPS